MSATLGAEGAPEARLVEISNGIFAFVQPEGTWWVNNAGFVAGKRGVVSVDSCATESRTRRYLRAVAEVTDQPVRTLVNTHHHGDHTNGNYLFSGATVVGHESTRAGVLAASSPPSAAYWTPVDWGDLRVEAPFLTFADGLTLWVDDLRCEVRHVGMPAHTLGDSFVWIPERRVLFAGDLVFNGCTPLFVQGSLAGAITALTEVLTPLQPAIVVPGHGPVCGSEVLEEVLGYLRFVQALAVEGVAAAMSPLDLARSADLGVFSTWTDAERLVANLHRGYAELAGAGPGAPIDVGAAFEDMVAYNGGRPLSCLA